MTAVIAPVARGDLLGNQGIGGVGVGDPQERFGQAHQGEALGIGEPELLEKGLDHPGAVGFGPRLEDDIARALSGCPPLRLVQRRVSQKRRNARCLIDGLVRVERVGGVCREGHPRPRNRESGRTYAGRQKAQASDFFHARVG